MPTPIDLIAAKTGSTSPTRSSWAQLDKRYLAGRTADMAEIALQAEQLRTTLQSLSDGVITIDRDGRITQMNDCAAQLSGNRLANASGQPIRFVLNLRDSVSGDAMTVPVDDAERDRVLLAATGRLSDSKEIDIPGPAFLRNLLMDKLDKPRSGSCCASSGLSQTTDSVSVSSRQASASRRRPAVGCSRQEPDTAEP